MNLLRKILFSLTPLLLIGVLFFGSIVYAEVPDEYYPNYRIRDSRQRLLDLFVEVEATARVADEIPSSLFVEMNNVFSAVFPHLPQSSTNQVVYRQCEIITDDLSNGVEPLEYLRFKDRCFTPLGIIIKEINANHTIKARATAKPVEGAAPLNVTFDGRDSIDPSNDTIPSDNFFWYYTDTDGREQTIGRGPVVNYTFRDPGNHIVHLTVRSVNSRTEGVFDGEASLSINVAPKAAEVILYVGGKRANANSSEIVKLGASNDTERGILLDATGTRPIGARTIQEHKRTISNDTAYTFTKEGEDGPGEFVHRFPQNGIYTIQIDIIDNESNRLSEKFKISISDPVAIIRQNPMQGTTSTEFTFDASASYAITSRLKTYQRTITDPEGNQTERVEGKELKRKFLIPGMYTIRLTVIDEDGSSSFETRQLSVGSTPPIPSFIMTPQSELKSPSQYIFDATASFDEDVRTGSDELSYQRLFSNNEYVSIERAIEDNNSIIKVSFDQLGTYRIKLIVTDQYGETATVEKDLDIESTLRPQLAINSQVSTRSDTITFIARANKPVAFYEWDFGDGEKQQSKTPKVEHIYTKAGTYPVKLRVITSSGEENTLSRQVFMGQKDTPLIGYQIKETGGILLQPTATCPNGTGLVSAYQIERYQNIQIDASMSRNAQGTTSDLSISFQPKNDELYNRSNLTYTFPEIGCTSVDLFVEDSNLGKTSIEKIHFEIVNALPELQNLTLTFPQAGGGSPIGVGTDTNSVSQQDLFTDASIGSIVVRVQAKGARDPDGFISHYRRWYYPSEDPSRKEGFKITPADVPYATFIVPKPPYATEYAFAVELIDNDDGRVKSEDIVGKGPIIFFPPGENSLDIPIVTMKTNATTTRVGEEVTFTTNATVLSDRPDFTSSRYFKYDFDGDGQYDIPSTKQSTITHVYTQPGTYRPKVAVYYRGRAGVGNTEPITVLKGLKPRFVVNQAGNTVLFEDFSIGDIIDRQVCMDETKCPPAGQLSSDTENSSIYSEIPFVHTYNTPGRYTIRLDVTDEFGNQQSLRQIVTTTDNTDTDSVQILSVPDAIPVGSGYEITLSEAIDYQLALYLSSSQNCYADLNLEADSDGDGDTTIDEDVVCNTLVAKPLFPFGPTQQGRIYSVHDGRIIETPLTFVFPDKQIIIPDEYQWAGERIDSLLTAVDGESHELQPFLVQLLQQLQATLGEIDEMNSVLIQLRDLIDNTPDLLASTQREQIISLIETLGDDIVLDSFGGTEYQISKANVIGLLNIPYKDQVRQLFDQFEQVQGDQIAMKSMLDQIFTLAGEARAQGSSDAVDFAYIQSSLCDIILYYELPSTTCGSLTDDTTDSSLEDDNENNTSGNTTSPLRKVLRVVVYVVIGLAVLIGIMIAIFAIKARRRQNEEETAGE